MLGVPKNDGIPKLLGTVETIPYRAPNARISPIIKFARWTALLYGIYWGRKRLMQLQAFEAKNFVEQDEIKRKNYKQALAVQNALKENDRIDVIHEVECVDKKIKYGKSSQNA